MLSGALYFPQNYQESIYAFQDWAIHHMDRNGGLQKQETGISSFLPFSTSIYRMPTVGQILCWLLVPT